MAITVTTDMKYTRPGAAESNVLSAHNPLIWEFEDGAIAASPTATVQIVVKNNATATIYTSAVFPAYLLSYADPVAKFRFDATQIIKHIINNYFYKETSAVIEAENYGSEIEVTFKSYDNTVLEDTDTTDYFASHAINQIGDEYGANIPRIFLNDTEEIAHFLGFPNHLFFHAPITLAAETPVTEILPAVANQITGWTNHTDPYDYDTFESTGTEITSAIELAGSAYAKSNTFSINAGESIRVVLNLTLNGGIEPSVVLYDGIVGDKISNQVDTANGDNYIILTAFETKVNDCRIVITVAAASNFSTDAVHAQLLHAYSEEGTLGLFMHDLNLGLFQLNNITKHVLVKYDPTGPTLIKTFNLSVFQPCANAVYIRFLTKDGIYMYWAFSPFPYTNKDSQDVGKVINSFSEMALANSRNYPIGKKDAFHKLDVAAASVPIVFRRKLMELFTSPAVYLWQGTETPDENLISVLTNFGYETFSSSGTVIISAIENVGAPGGSALSSGGFNVTKGEKITVIFNLSLTSGTAPSVRLADASAITTASDIINSAAGQNIIKLTSIVDALVKIRWRTKDADATEFSTSKIIVKRAEVETDWIMLEKVEGSHTLREKKDADKFECTLVYPEKYTQQLGRTDQ